MYLYSAVECVLCTVHTELDYLRVLISEITELRSLIIQKNIDTSVVMRVVIENFNMTASEMARVWAQQDEYIDLLESQLRKSEENLRKESQRMQMFRWKVIKKKLEVHEKNAEIAKLKASLAWSPDEVLPRHIVFNFRVQHIFQFLQICSSF